MIVVHYFPIYWGVETDAPDRSLVTRSTMDEVLPPFRKSIWAFRIRLSPKRWLHVGWFEYNTIDNYWGMTASTEEIRQWRGPHVEQDQEPEDPLAAEDEVRQVQ